jgi:MFS family permease
VVGAETLAERLADRSSAPRRLPAALQSLRHRNYRLLWIGTLISNSGDWMDQIALNWLVYQLSGSAVQLALLNLCRLAPIFVFTLLGGVIADRMERRRLLFATQFIAMVLAVVLLVLALLANRFSPLPSEADDAPSPGQIWR